MCDHSALGVMRDRDQVCGFSLLKLDLFEMKMDSFVQTMSAWEDGALACRAMAPSNRPCGWFEQAMVGIDLFRMKDRESLDET